MDAFESGEYLMVEEIEQSWASNESAPLRTPFSKIQQTRSKSFASFLSSRTAQSNKPTGPQPTTKEINILKNSEKIMEAQNKWKGNGKFIIKNKATFFVSLAVIKLIKCANTRR